MVLEAKPVLHISPFVMSSGAPLTTEIVISRLFVGNERWPRHPSLHTLNNNVFKCGRNNSTTIKYIDNECANLIDIYEVAFDGNDRTNQIKIN